MILENGLYRLEARRAERWLEAIGRGLADALPERAYPLRFSVVEAGDGEVVVEATLLRWEPGSPYEPTLGEVELLDPRPKSRQASPFCAVQIVPTGVGCELGGFAGDACPVTNLLAATVDFLVTHPNAVNASELNEMAGNVLYVEGKSLDDFLLGHLGLARVASNRIGTFVDPTGVDYMDEVVNTLGAARAAAGIDCPFYTLLEEELGVRIEWSRSGCALGLVLRPDAIARAVETLLGEGADAVGGVSVIHGVTTEMFERHQRGEIPNPSGGVEAIITHLVSKLFRVPTAHAPLPYYQDVKPRTRENPRVAAELISTPHYFSVLKGLAKAPRLVPIASPADPPADLLTLNNVAAIVMPASCLGGVPALAAELSGIPLVAVRENETVLDVTNDSMRMENVIQVDSYLAAAGVLTALRSGIALESLRRPIHGAREIEPSVAARDAALPRSA
jgi:Protein of unknown function (DUF3326)